MISIVWETPHFLVEVPPKPHVTRMDGGHLQIMPKERVSDRTQLSGPLAIELARLTIIAGAAMNSALNQQGIDVGRINYQDNGNWSVHKPQGPMLHIHLYGRAKSAAIQKWGDALHFPHMESGFYDANEPLNEDDIALIKKEMQTLFTQEEFQDHHWKL